METRNQELERRVDEQERIIQVLASLDIADATSSHNTTKRNAPQRDVQFSSKHTIRPCAARQIDVIYFCSFP